MLPYILGYRFNSSKRTNLENWVITMSECTTFLTEIANLINHFPEWIFIISNDQYLIDCNKSALKAFKQPKQNLIGEHLWKLPFFNENMHVKDIFDNLIDLAQKDHEKHFEGKYEFFNNKQRLLECTVAPLNSKNENFFLIIFRDNTPSNQIFSTFDESEFDYQNIFERCSAGLCIQKGKKIVAMNKAFAEMLQLDDKHYFEAMTPADISPELQPDGQLSIEKALDILQKAQEQGSHQFEWMHKRLDGSKFMVEVHLVSLGEKSDTLLAVWHDISQSKKREEKLLLLKSELEELIKERTKELENSIEEIQFMQEKLIESRKLSAMSSLVKGFSHEISTPIGNGLTTASFLDICITKLINDLESSSLTRNGLDSKLSELYEGIININSNLQKASNLIHAFKDLDRDSTVRKIKSIKLLTTAEEAVACFSSEIEKQSIEVILDIPENITFTGDFVALYLIFENLISNSISHGFANTEQKLISINVESKENFIQMVYKDNGIGMNSETISKVYDPFFTTKRAHGHLGIGMSIVYNQVQICQGEISVCSPDEGGIEVKISFPSSSQ